MPYHRNNFESEMLTMQHQEVMTDMKKMSEQVNRALVKCTHLTLENDWYWWVTYKVVTPAQDTACVSPFLSLK